MFGIPSIEKTVFHNDFINNVIVSGSFSNNRSCAEQRQSLKERYAEMLPIQTDQPQQQYKINIDVKTNQTSIDANVDEKERQVTLRSRNMQKELNLTNSTFHYRENGMIYGTASTFDNAVKPAFDYLTEVGVEQLNTLQLRKTNAVGFEMKANDGEYPVQPWQTAVNLINPRLVPQFQAMLETATMIKQHISNMQLTDGDYALIINYGFAVTERDAESSNVKGQVILDLEITRKAAVFSNEIIKELERMHQELYNAFRWCISDAYMELLNQEGGH